MEDDLVLDAIGRPSQSWQEWDSDRFLLGFEWSDGERGSVGTLRLRVAPSEGESGIGHLELAPAFRGQRIARSIVRTVEEAARRRSFQTLRLFTRWKAAGFWKRLGFRQEPDPRFFRKSLGEESRRAPSAAPVAADSRDPSSLP